MKEYIKTNPNTKTITIGAIPMWETKKHLKPYISEESSDRRRSENYGKVKEVLDTYARAVIEIATQSIVDEGMYPTYDRLEELFLNSSDKKSATLYKNAKADFKKQAANIIKKVAGYYQLTKEFGKLFAEDKSALFINAKDLGIEKETLDVLSLYNKFTSYFHKYFTSLSDVTLCGTEHGSIANRIMENMEIYWKNQLILEETKKEHGELYVQILDSIDKMDIDMCVTQYGIDTYNYLLGNIEGTGVNSLISMYAQKNKVRVKLLKTLNKIPLAKKEKQFVINSIDNDEELKHTIKESIVITETIFEYAKTTTKLAFDTEIKESTYVLERHLHTLSHLMYGNHDVLERALKEVTLSEKEKKEHIVSLVNIDKAMTLIEDVPKKGCVDIVKEAMAETLKAEKLKNNIVSLCESTSLKANRKQIKEFYDYILEARRKVSFFYTGEIENTFVEEIDSMKDTFAEFNKIYNMVRNYCTKNPIDKKSYELYFNKGTFLTSFDSDKFKEGISLSTLLRKDGMYYLYILNPGVSTKLSAKAYVSEGGYDRLVYKQLTGLNKMFPKCLVKSSTAEELYGLTDEIRDICDNKKYTKEYVAKTEDREPLTKWIQYCIDSFYANEEWSKYYNIPFRPATEYETANEFYTECERHTTYMDWSEHLDEEYVRNSVKEGNAFLFQLYNHDFSPYHTGKDGNYTRILKEMFSDANMEKINQSDNSAIKLSGGGAKLRFRKASIPYKETHKAGEALKNKNPLNPKKTSSFDYGICKDRRFMKDSFIFSIGVQMGYRNEEVQVYDLNRMVNKELLEEKRNVLTVRVGEEHLLYYMVTDANGKVLEQKDLNIIESSGGGVTIRTDYKELLKRRESEMAIAKEEWDYSVDIKDIKAAYVGNAINVLLKIRDKYDAVILLEDYSGDFVNKRKANVKSIYQMFQMALLNKLSCYVSEGSLYSEAVQLASPASSLDDIKGQKGIVYFVNSSYTANTDHSSAFVNQYYEHFVYENKKKAEKTCEKLDVNFDEKKKEFIITIEDKLFGIDSNNTWLLHTNGERSIWKDKKITSFNCTSKLAELMKEYHISEFKEYKDVADKKFYERFFEIMRVLLKMHYMDPDTNESYFLSPITGYDSRCNKDGNVINSSSEKTYLIMMKGIRDLNNINKETLFIDRDEKGSHKNKWLEYLRENCKK